MFLTRIIKRSFAYRSSRYILLFAILLSGSAILSFSLSTSLSIKTLATKFISSTGAQLFIFHKEFFEKPELLPSIPHGVLKGIKEFLDSLDIEYTLTPYYYTIAFFRNTPLAIIGTDFSAMKMTRPYLKVGRAGLWIGWRVAERWDLSEGDTILLNTNNSHKKFLISGIVKTGGEEDTQVILPVEMLRSFIPVTEPTLLEIRFRNLGIETITSLQKTLRDSFSLEVMKPEDQFRSIKDFAFGIERILWSITGLILLSVLIVCFGVALFITSQRTKEIAILKTLGAKKSQLALFLLAEALILGILSGLLGFVLGYAISNKMSPWILNAPLSFHPLSFIATILITILLSIFGFLYPLKRILPVKPAGILRGE